MRTRNLILAAAVAMSALLPSSPSRAGLPFTAFEFHYQCNTQLYPWAYASTCQAYAIGVLDTMGYLQKATKMDQYLCFSPNEQLGRGVLFGLSSLTGDITGQPRSPVEGGGGPSHRKVIFFLPIRSKSMTVLSTNS